MVSNWIKAKHLWVKPFAVYPAPSNVREGARSNPWVLLGVAQKIQVQFK